MKILFVTKAYYPYIGGIATQLRLVAHGLAKQHQVEVVAIAFSNDKPGRLGALFDRVMKLLGLPHAPRQFIAAPFQRSHHDGPVRVHSVAPSLFERVLLLVSRGRLFKRIYTRKLRRIIKDVDIVHAMKKGRLGVLSESIAREEGVPFAVTPYIHPEQKPVGFRADFADRADLVFALLESDAARLVDLGVSHQKIRLLGVVPLLPPVKDPEAFRIRHGLDKNPFVLFVGRVIEYKGVKAMLEATDRVWQQMPAVHFVFAGPVGAQERQWFESRADHRIRLMGQVTDQEKADALAACDVFCMPSKYEILPAVYLEAWACGKAVIGGTAFGLRELIEGNAAGVVTDHEPDTIALAILDLLKDSARRHEMGENGRALVEKRFSESALVRTLEGAYGELRARH